MQEPALIAIYRKKREIFYDLRAQILFDALVEMFEQKQPIDIETLWLFLKKKKAQKYVDNLAGLTKIYDLTPSPANHEYYYGMVREKAALRVLRGSCEGIIKRIDEFDGQEVQSFVGGIQADLDTVSRLISNKPDKRQLELWKPSELRDYTIPETMRLIGDNEIIMGYDGLFLIAGPGSVGKSLIIRMLALAGAIGSGLWMGRAVQRQYRVMILQAEDGAVRLKKEMQEMQRQHPEVDFDSFIRISTPPEGGLPFHNATFRSEVRDSAADFKPEMVLLDTWAQTGTEDAAKDTIEKFTEIRSCFTHLTDFPSIGISAHTKKPRSEDVRRGKALINTISGSQQLGNAPRTVYMLLPWSDDFEDDRVYWAMVKANNCESYPATVWRRRFGTFFQHDPLTDPREFGRQEDDKREKITFEHLQMVFDGSTDLRQGDLIKKLMKVAGCGESTAYRVIGSGEGGYLREHLRFFQGKISLIEKQAENGKHEPQR